MKKPLRWAYPQSYQLVKGVAAQAGIHLYDFEVLVDGEAGAPTVMVEHRGTVWTETFPSEDLLRATVRVSDFFAAVMDELVLVTERAYQDFMHHREV